MKIDWGAVYFICGLVTLGAMLAEGTGFLLALILSVFWPVKVGMWLYVAVTGIGL
jgi:hypothetical protein